MNELERLKQAEEAEPMAVLVMPWPKKCRECQEKTVGTYIRKTDSYTRYCTRARKTIEDIDTMPEWCPLRKAIGIIEPNGHVVYLREEEE